MPSFHTEHSDVSAVVERGTELDLATALFRTVFDSSPVGMLLVDGSGTIRAANRAISSMFETTDRWPIGVDAASLLPALEHRALADAAGIGAAPDDPTPDDTAPAGTTRNDTARNGTARTDAADDDTAGGTGPDDEQRPATGPSFLGLVLAYDGDGRSIPVEASVDSVDAGGAVFALVYLRDVSGQQAAANDLADAEAGLYEATQLHDDIIQRMFGAGMRLRAAMAMSQTAGVREQIEVAADGLDLAITELREAIARNGGLD